MRPTVPGVIAFFTLACSQGRANSPTILDAVRDGDHAAVLRMLEADSEAVDFADQNLATPLHLAVGGNDEEIARLLLEHRADPNLQDHEGHAPLHLAGMYGYDAMVNLLLDHAAKVELRDNYQRTPLLLVARESGSEVAARALLAHGAEVDAVDRFDDSSLHLAAWRGFEGLVDLLLEQGAALDPGGKGAGVLTQFAAEGGLERLFRELVAAEVDLGGRTFNGGSLLHAAAVGGSEEIVEALLDRGLEVGEVDRYGWTPLHYAAEKGREKVSELLIARGADVNAASLGGHTPLSVTDTYQKTVEATLLEAHGAVRAPEGVRPQGPWMGEESPGPEPLVFALDVVSSVRFEHGTVTFSPDGTEAFWESSFMPDETGYSHGRILTSRLEEEGWTVPEYASFSPDFDTGGDVPFLAPDGQKLYFDSTRPVDGRRAERIWVVERTPEGWGEPEVIQGGPNTMGMHWQFSVAVNGNIYVGSGDPGGFGASDIWLSRLVDGAYQVPENLGPMINSQASENSPFIAPDESYLIFTGMDRPETMGGIDLYISFKTPEGEWTEAVNMGPTVNGPSYEMCPMVSGDGRFLFFNSRPQGNADNYWMDAGIIGELRARALGGRP